MKLFISTEGAGSLASPPPPGLFLLVPPYCGVIGYEYCALIGCVLECRPAVERSLARRKLWMNGSNTGLSPRRLGFVFPCEAKYQLIFRLDLLIIGH